MNKKEVGKQYFHLVAMIFVAMILISNTIAVKIVYIWGFILPAGILCFPVTYIFGDILTEVYGYEKTRSVIWGGFFCQILMSFFYWLSIKIEPANFWEGQEYYARFFGLVPRIVLASIVAYLLGEFLNSFTLSILKLRTKGKYLWIRTIGSTIVGQSVDSFVFNFTAFLGIYSFSNVAYIAFSGYILKVAYEAIATPITYFIVGKLKHAEGIDHFDYGANYNPFKIKANNE